MVTLWKTKSEEVNVATHHSCQTTAQLFIVYLTEIEIENISFLLGL